MADLPPFFDIVNGFFNRCRGDMARSIFGSAGNVITINQIDYLAEIILSATAGAVPWPLGHPALSLVVWTLKCEVRAFGGCLGMYRR